MKKYTAFFTIKYLGLIILPVISSMMFLSGVLKFLLLTMVFVSPLVYLFLVRKHKKNYVQKIIYSIIIFVIMYYAALFLNNVQKQLSQSAPSLENSKPKSIF